MLHTSVITRSAKSANILYFPELSHDRVRVDCGALGLCPSCGCQHGLQSSDNRLAKWWRVLMLSSFINLELISNPYNWLIITLILIFGAYSAYLIYKNAAVFTPHIPAV